MTVLLYLALLPAIALMVYVYRKDKVESEPIGLVIRVFLLGAASGIVAGFVESVLISAFEAVMPAGALLIIVECFIGVAMVEEACKYLCLLTVRKNPAFDYVFDAIVYAVAAALGFAAFENVLYVLDGGIEVAVVRAIFSVPGHMADGVVMGVFFGFARQRELHGNVEGAHRFYWLAYILPVIEHGFYDAALSFDNDLSVLVAFGTDLVFIGIAFFLVRHASKNDARLSPNVGTVSSAPYQRPVQLGVYQQLAQPMPYRQWGARQGTAWQPSQPGAPQQPSAQQGYQQWGSFQQQIAQQQQEQARQKQ